MRKSDFVEASEQSEAEDDEDAEIVREEARAMLALLNGLNEVTVEQPQPANAVQEAFEAAVSPVPPSPRPPREGSSASGRDAADDQPSWSRVLDSPQAHVTKSPLQPDKPDGMSVSFTPSTVLLATEEVSVTMAPPAGVSAGREEPAGLADSSRWKARWQIPEEEQQLFHQRTVTQAMCVVGCLMFLVVAVVTVFVLAVTGHLHVQLD